jgi:hypothetical protein
MSNLYLQTLLASIEAVARAKGVKAFRTDYKRNKRGELVIALIVADDEGPLGRMNIP